MRFSEAWLKEWVNPQMSSEQLAEQLSMAGLEVDAVDPVAGAFSGVVIGEVVECDQHPDADKLRVTKVNVGQEQPLDIVCGAPNCRQGLKVAVALVGAVLPGEFKIKKAKLRGQPSHGMLCSFSELGISEDHDGIIELANDAPVGMDIRDYLQLDDNAIAVDLTPNRADCLGIKGLAREVGVLNQQDVKPLTITPVSVAIEDSRPVVLADPQACPRYLGRIIRQINLGAVTPLWLKEKLRRSGIRSIDPVVDVTNYVLLELGHPMHAFDNNQLAGTVTVRYAKAGETLTLLDGNQVDLQTNTLVIADDQKPLAIAGVFGGLDSGVTSETSDIFLESAFFHPDAILGKARQYGLHTDASHRYERGVDPQLQRDAMERATQLLLDIVGGQAGPIVEAVSESHIPQAKEVILRHSRLSRVLGIEIDGNTVSDILSRLGFEPALNGANTAKQLWTVSIPAYRFDVSIEEDLIEEVARVFGYNSIPEVSPVGRLNMTPRPEGQLKLSDLKRRLTERDYQEAITYSFVDPQKQHILHSDIQGKMLPHPISADMSVMRVSLWTGLLQAVGYNQNRQQARVRLFESGLRFVPDANDKTGVRQEPVIAGVIAGNRHTEYWENNDRVVDFFDAKADLEALLSQFVSTDDIVFKSASHSALHPGQTAAIYQADRLIGYLGTLHPKLEKPFELNGRTIIWELHLDGLSELPIPKAREISRYPANRRDIAIVVKDEVLSGELIAYMKNCGEKHLVAVNLFDLYQGKGIEEGYKSLAISLIFQDVERTLEEQEIQNGVAKLLHGLKDKFGAILRD